VADGTGRESGPGGTKKLKSVLSGQPPLEAAVIDLKIERAEPAKRLEGPRAAVDLALPIETEILGNHPEPSGKRSGSGRFEAKQAAKSVFGEFLADEYEAVGSFFFVARGNSSNLIQRVAKLKEEILPCFRCMRGTQTVQEGSSTGIRAVHCVRAFQ